MPTSKTSPDFSAIRSWLRNQSPADLLRSAQAEQIRRATEAALRAEAEKGEVSLYTFVKLAWRVLEPDTPFVDGWHIEAICRHLEAVTDGKITRLLINVPPGSSKSLIVSVFWPAWEWGPKNRPHLRYLSTSYKDDYVKRDTRRTRDLVMSEWYQRLWGDRVHLTRTAETSFENSARGNREGATFNSLTGGRGDRVLVDDPHSVDSAESELERAAVTRRFRESVPSRVNDPIRSAIVIIMQRLHEADVSGVIASLKLPYVHLMIPMEFEPERACVTHIGSTEFWRDPRTQDGELMCPERWPREIIEQEKINQGPYAWSGQYQQRPAPRGGAMIREEWLQWYEKPPARSTLKIYMASDYAVSENQGDYTVHGVFGVDPMDRIFVLDWWRGQATSLGWIEELFRLVKKWEPAIVAEESGQIIKSLGPVIQKLQRERKCYFSRRQYVSHQKKDVRAQGIRARLEMGMVYFPIVDPENPDQYGWVTDLVYELVRFPAVAHDDQVDVMSLLGRMLNALGKGHEEPAPEPPLVVGPNTYTIQELIKSQPKPSRRI